ncbi:HET domain containing protein [Hyaloscypha variabilis]
MEEESSADHFDGQSVPSIPPHKPSITSFFETAAIGIEQSYQYSLLPDPKTYIRLLKLSAEVEEIVGSLEAFPVSEAPEFCALSYAWGDDPPSSVFICESARLPVTEHLFSGMKRVRNCNPTPWIWIDAICINQKDDEEKADQIPLMEKIYSRAQHVLVYLGEATRETGEALEQLEHIRVCIQNANGPIFRSGSSYVEAGLPTIEDPFWQTLADFYCRSWFQRLWILQEVILAKDILFMCGTRVLEFELLSSSALQLYQGGICGHLTKLVSNIRDIQGYSTLIDLGLLRDTFSTSLLNAVTMLNQARGQRVKEPVDRIYGLLGLMEEWVRQENAARFAKNQPVQWYNRSFFVTHFGLLGLCSQSCRPGDIVCIFHSMEHPYILRKVLNKSTFTLVSCAYCDGVMYGEALDVRDPAKDEIFIID